MGVDEVLPLAIAIAASPFPVIPSILMLFTARPRVTSAAFLAGWLVGVLAAVTVFTALSSFVEMNEQTPVWASWSRIVLGVALIIVGARQWLGRGGSDEPPGWMKTVEDSTPRTAFRLALLLSAANPKILLLAGAGGLSIGAADLTAAGTIATVLAFSVVASVVVALPLALYLVRGERVLVPLGHARDWLKQHNKAIMAVVILVIGVLLVSNGTSEVVGGY